MAYFRWLLATENDLVSCSDSTLTPPLDPRPVRLKKGLRLPVGYNRSRAPQRAAPR
jgi:hypothetical protein